MAAPQQRGTQPCLSLDATGFEYTPHTDVFLSASFLSYFLAKTQCLKQSDCTSGVGDEQREEEKSSVSLEELQMARRDCKGRGGSTQCRFSFQVSCSQDLHAISWMWFAPRATSTAVKFQQMNNVVFNKFHQAKERILTRSC